MSDADRPLIGRTLGGRFTITGFIGEGAMAAVYRGEQLEEPRAVAVKVMHEALAEDKTFVKRFWREAKAAVRLKHANTVQVLEYGVDAGTVFIAMELLGGQDLFDVLARERRFTERRAAQVLLQICDALEAAHEQGIVHRDLKPENVMLLADPADSARDVVKVLDFGIAKILDREVSDAEGPPSSPMSSAPGSALTQVGTVIGTPEYMSPEQCRGEPVDARSDVYACGVLLYRLVAGRAPFVGDSPIAVAMSHVSDPPVTPSTYAPGLNPGLGKVILTALAKWPAQRQQSARELGEEIRALLPELSVAGRQSLRIGTSSKVQAAIAEGVASGKISLGGAALPGLPEEVKITAEERGAKRSSPAPERAKTPVSAPAAKEERSSTLAAAKAAPAVEAEAEANAAPVVAEVKAAPVVVEATAPEPEAKAEPVELPSAAATVRRPEARGDEGRLLWLFAAIVVVSWVALWILHEAHFP